MYFRFTLLFIVSIALLRLSISTALAQGPPIVSGVEVNSCIGEIFITVTSGVQPYSYRWEDSSGTVLDSKDDIIKDLTFGVYRVIVTDADGGTVTETFNISDPPPLTSDISISDVSCFNGTNGFVDIKMNNGREEFKYELFREIAGSFNLTRTEDQVADEFRISGLETGNYRLEVEDRPGCVGSFTFTIGQPDAPLELDLLEKIDPLCFAQSTGRISVEATGGTGGAGGYKFAWFNINPFVSDTLSKKSLVENLKAGDYRVRVTDDNGCTASLEFTLEDPEVLIFVDSIITDATCNADADGSIEVTATGGTGVLSYTWSNGGTTADISGLNSGDYTITITDENGCSIQATYTVNEPNVLAVSEAITNVNCRGENSGVIILTVSGGNGGNSFRWGDGNTRQNRTNMPAGNYSVVITDSQGCTVNETYTISEPVDGLNLDSVTNTKPTCIGDADGSLSVNVSGGVTPYFYSWNIKENSQTINNLSSGSYSVTVTDTNGCTLTVNTTLKDPEPISANISIVKPTCPTEVNGSITLNPLNGLGPYTYLWADGQTTNRIENLAAGSYSVRITDFNGCQSNSTITVTEPDVIRDNATVTNVSCIGQGNGSIQLNPTGGSESFTYLWNDGTTNNNISGLEPGGYSVTITDSNGCTFSNNYLITEPELLELTSSNTDVLCFGESTANIDIAITGGTKPYKYSWSNGARTEDLSNIPSGNYTVLVTDANGCTVSKAIQVSELSEPIIVNETIVNVGCSGEKSGSITIEVSGGSGGYRYLWSTGSTNKDIDNLGSGKYAVTVTDSNGCTFNRTYTVATPNELILTGIVVNNLCADSSQGRIDLRINGGTRPYVVSWNNGDTTEDLFNLLSDRYNVTVTDANGCSATAIFEIIEPSPIQVTSSIKGVTCFGQVDGSIELSITGGTGSYTFQWSNGRRSKDIRNLSGGDYTLVITDQNGCQITETITVPAPIAPINAISTTLGIACNGDNTGAINLEVSGGTAPYSYVWSNNSRLKDLRNVPPGDYQITITDANLCAFSTSFTLDQTEPILASFSAKEPTCIGDLNGSIEVEVSGGTGPYTYEWSNNSTSKDQFNLTSDQYTVIIRDANNCTLIQSIDLGGNRGLDIDVNTTNVSCKGDSNGAISIDVSGGSGNFSFQWDNGNTTKSLDNLSAGVYKCVVTDGEGCDNSITVVISEPSRNLEASIDYSARLSCFSGQDGYAVANPIGGTAPYNYMWSNFETDQRIEGLSRGNYSVIITDANNCTYQQSFEITEPDEQLVIQIEGKLELDCVGDSDGFIKIKLTGGEGPYEIRWSNGSPSNQLSDLRAGNYSVQVRDNAGCLLQQTISISQSEAIQITKVEINDTDCYGDRTGSINIDVAGGKKPYTFLWSNGTNQKNLSGVTTGNYNVIITDANNCTYQQTFNLDNAIRFELNPQISPISCRGAEDSSISLNIQGGTGPYSIVWNTGATDEIIRDLGPGVYEARVVDSNGCDITQTFNITDPSLITSTAIINDPLDCSDPTSGSIFLTTSGGTPPYSYEWTNGVTTSSIANISEGNYGVIIRDQFGCSITKTFSVTRPEEINIVLQSELIIDCESQNVTALVKAEVIGGLSDYAFAWNKSPGAESIAEISQSGRVVLNVTDRRGCQKIVEINLDFPEFSNADFIFNSASLDRDQLLSVFDSIYFKDLSGDAAVEWNWDFGDDFTSDLQNPSHSYVAPGDYQVSLFTTDEAGCQTSRSMILTLEIGYRVIIPSAFTPDGDGLNDFFQAKFIGLQSYRLSIFSKSGEIIFSTNEIDSRGWDGLIGGQVAMNGQYVYRFTGLSYTGIDIDRTGTFSSVN